MDDFMMCPADVRVLLHEGGILRENEKAVMLADNCVLLERDSGERLSYRIVNMDSYASKYLFARKEPLKREQYDKVVEKMDEMGMRSSIDKAPISRKQRAQWLLGYVFDEILPQHGMQIRDSQKELAMVMLDALAERKIALCEAQVGTGKTHAYVLAVTVYNLFAPKKICAVISTSTIALQKALTEIYIPQISGILLEHGIIEEPLSFTIRKGKGHYACDLRLDKFLRMDGEMKAGNDEAVMETLKELQKGGMRSIDLDKTLLPP